MPTPQDPTRSFSTLDSVVAGYLQAVESGLSPDRGEVLANHPELAAILRAFFDDLDRIDRVASPLRLGDETEASGSPSTRAPATIQYFGDYELLHEIARGGMGVVYKARQVTLNRVVALKMVLAGTLASSRDVQRFRLEAESAANLDHPHIVPIYEVGEHEERHYFSMKFVDGPSLGRHPRGSFRDEVAGLIPVAEAVHHAHLRGVLHRDLKPSNVLVDPEAGWLVTDFGLAKRLSDVDGSLTETGAVLGTPRYMAPEQASGRRDLTVAADVYSLGAILYERLTGRAPFLADNVVTLLHQVRESEPPRPSSLMPGIGPDLETAVLKCLDKDPSRRYSSAGALAADLANWLAGRPILARPVGRVDRAWRWCKRNPVLAAMVAAVAASLLAGTAVSLAFAVRAEAMALDAGLAATRSRILLAKDLCEVREDREEKFKDEGMLTYARAFALAPPGRQADPLRWNIMANLAVAAQGRRPLYLDRRGFDQPAVASSLSPNGIRWAEAGPEGIVRVWDVADGRLLATFDSLSGGVSSLVFDPDGRQLATVSRLDGGLLYNQGQRALRAGGWNYDLKPIDFGKGDRTVRIWDAATGRMNAEFQHDLCPYEAEFSPNSKHIFTRSDVTGDPSQNGAAFLWDIPGKRLLSKFPVRNALNGLAAKFSPDNKFFAVGGLEVGKFLNPQGLDIGKVRIFELDTGRHMYDVPGDFVAWDPTGRELASEENTTETVNGTQQKIRFYEATSGRPLISEPILQGISRMNMWKFSYSPDGKFVVRSGTEVHSRCTGRLLVSLPDEVNAFSPDGSVVDLYGGQVYDTTSWRRLRPENGERFHTALKRNAMLGHLTMVDGEVMDLATALSVELNWSYILDPPPEIPGGLPYSSGDVLNLLPREPFSTDARTVELWAEVFTRRTLVGDRESEPLSESDWEAKRLELLDRLPRSPSPLLSNLAKDRAHWRREEARSKSTGETRLVAALDRLIEIEPTWYYRHSRGLAYAAQGRWNEAARDFLTAGREAGSWYWRSPPSILKLGDSPESPFLESGVPIGRLLLEDDPERLLRDLSGCGAEVAEVAMYYLTYLRKSDERLRDSVKAVMSLASPPSWMVAKSLEITRRLIGGRAVSVKDLGVHGMALFRAGLDAEAEDSLKQAIEKDRVDKEPSDGGPMISRRDLRVEKIYLAMVYARRGRPREARALLDGVSIVDDKAIVSTLLNEAEGLIQDLVFPADPFAK